MRSREEQIVDMVDATGKAVLRGRSDYSMELYQKWIEQELARAEQRGREWERAEIAKRHTWFYMVDDPENGHLDMADMLCETKPFEIVETAESADIRIFFAFQDEEGEIHEFSTRAEAERAAIKASDAAMNAENGNG